MRQPIFAALDSWNQCHQAVVRLLPNRRFRIRLPGGQVLKYDAATTLKWLQRNADQPRRLDIL